MTAINIWLSANPLAPAILLGALLATVGWIYTARRARSLARRQHTFNALLGASFNTQYQDALNAVRPHTRDGIFPDLNADENAELKTHVGFLLNHYEFLSAGIRIGDISEQLLKDSERGTIIRLFETAEPFITAVRDSRKRSSTFEHIEWLYERWHEDPPSWWQIALEFCAGRPFYHRAYSWWVAGAFIVIALAAVIYGFH